MNAFDNDVKEFQTTLNNKLSQEGIDHVFSLLAYITITLPEKKDALKNLQALSKNCNVDIDVEISRLSTSIFNNDGYVFRIQKLGNYLDNEMTKYVVSSIQKFLIDKEKSNLLTGIHKTGFEMTLSLYYPIYEEYQNTHISSIPQIKDKYFILEDNKKSKALSLKKLMKTQIDENTLVLKEGMKDWTQAKNIQEIELLISNYVVTSNIKKKKKKKKEKLQHPVIDVKEEEEEKSIKKVGTIYLLVFIGLLTFIFIIALINKNSTTNTYPLNSQSNPISNSNGGPQNDEVLYDPKTDTTKSNPSENVFNGGEGNMYNEPPSSTNTITTGRTSTNNTTQSINKADEPTMGQIAREMHATAPTNDFERQMREFDHNIQLQQQQKKQRSLYDKMTYEEAEPLHYMDADKIKRK